MKRSNIKPSLKNFSLRLSNSVNNVVADRHLYFKNFENDKREEVYSADNFVGDVLFEDSSNHSKVAQEIDYSMTELKDN